MNQAVAHLRFTRMAPRKLRRVADAIRGKSVKDALVLLKFAGVFAAEPMEKLLRSAVANAENNHDLNADDLVVSRVTVDGGPGGTLTKRLDPRAQGRANFKRKRLSHVTLVLSEGVKKARPAAAPAKPAAQAATKSSAGRAARKKTRAAEGARKRKTSRKAGAKA